MGSFFHCSVAEYVQVFRFSGSAGQAAREFLALLKLCRTFLGILVHFGTFLEKWNYHHHDHYLSPLGRCGAKDCFIVGRRLDCCIYTCKTSKFWPQKMPKSMFYDFRKITENHGKSRKITENHGNIFDPKSRMAEDP